MNNKNYKNRTSDGKFCRKYWNKRDKQGKFKPKK